MRRRVDKKLPGEQNQEEPTVKTVKNQPEQKIAYWKELDVKNQPGEQNRHGKTGISKKKVRRSPHRRNRSGVLGGSWTAV